MKGYYNMSVIISFINLVLHLNQQLPILVQQYHNYIYVILFFIIFCETGLVITPFLPGDSLIFATGALAAMNTLNPLVVFVVMFIASVCGDNVNYRIGHFLSDKIKSRKKIRFIKTEYIEKTHSFYEKHGGKTVILAKFMPIIRTFSPFVAGVGAMTYKRFLFFDVIGSLAWVSFFFLLGNLVGNIPFVQKNFSIVEIAIIVISLIPAVTIFIKEKFFTKEIIKIGKNNK
jgi:membrane-associated protein